MPALLGKANDRRRVVGLFAGIALLGIGAMAVAPGHWPLATIALVAVGIGGSFAIGMTLPLDHASSPDEANSWNSFVLSVGYLLGALGPVTIGLLRDRTGNFHAALWTLVAAATVELAVAPFLARATPRVAPAGSSSWTGTPREEGSPHRNAEALNEHPLQSDP